MKIHGFFFAALILICGTFISCKETKLINNIQFVEINLPAQDKEPALNLFVSRTEITQAQFSEMMKVNPSKVQNDQLPVTNISYADAFRYCNKLNKFFGFKETYKIDEKVADASGNPLIEEIPDVQGFRLLHYNEAERLLEKYYTADNSRGYITIRYIGKGWHGNRLHKVAHYIPDSFGLFDFDGNAREFIYFTGEDSELYNEEERSSKTVELDYGIVTYEVLKEHVNENFANKYKNYFVSAADATGFRICCPATIDKSKLDILFAKNVDKDREEWIKSNFEKLRPQLEFVPCEEYSYQVVGENMDGSKKKINIFVSEMNAGKTEISKELYNFVMENQLYDGIESPDFLNNHRDYYYMFSTNLKEEDYIGEQEPKTNIDYLYSIEFCNRLSKLCGLTPCYIQGKKYTTNSNHPYDYEYSYDPTANGYRLPTKSEFISFEAQYNTREEINFDPTHWNWTEDNFTEQPYTTDMYNPLNLYPSADKVIYRYAGEKRKPIMNSMNHYWVENERESKSPNFCLRLFQTTKPEQLAEYKQKQEEVVAAKIEEVFDSAITMKKYEGGLKTYSESTDLPDAEIADFEISDRPFSNYLYKTLTGKINHSESNKNKKDADVYYDEIAQICNKLSELRGFEKCYFQNADEWKCDYTKNGYRLPTVAEFFATSLPPGDEVYAKKTLCNDIYVSSYIPVWETSFPHGDYDFDGAEKEHVFARRYGDLDDYTIGEFLLCRTLDTEKISELLAKNKEDKKLLASKIDEMLEMIEFSGGKYTMSYKDSETAKDVKKTQNLKPFKIMSTRFTYGLAKKLYDKKADGKDDKIYEKNLTETMLICNELSLLAKLTPYYKINGKVIPTGYSSGDLLKKINEKFSYQFEGECNAEDVNFENKIEYNEKSNGYRLPQEIEWVYAGTLGTDPSEKIELMDTSEVKISKPEPATKSGLYFMNTLEGEWCNDEGPVIKYVDPEIKYYRGIEGGYIYQSHVLRYHCSPNSISHDYGYYTNYQWHPEIREIYGHIYINPAWSSYPFRIVRYN